MIVSIWLHLNSYILNATPTSSIWVVEHTLSSISRYSSFNFTATWNHNNGINLLFSYSFNLSVRKMAIATKNMFIPLFLLHSRMHLPTNPIAVVHAVFPCFLYYYCLLHSISHYEKFFLQLHLAKRRNCWYADTKTDEQMSFRFISNWNNDF